MDNRFKYRAFNREKALKFGFRSDSAGYIYEQDILDGTFRLVVTINSTGEVSTKVLDNKTGDEYIMYKLSSSGNFVGQVREHCDSVLDEIARECFDPDSFKNTQTKEIIAYIKDKYGDELEFLWENFPTDAIFRRKDNKKWYALLMSVKNEKLNLSSTGESEVLDIRCDANAIQNIVDGKKILPGYHMNKKHWITIVLDNRLDMATTRALIDDSYMIAGKK